jgi:hypothetical protein
LVRGGQGLSINKTYVWNLHHYLKPKASKNNKTFYDIGWNLYSKIDVYLSISNKKYAHIGDVIIAMVKEAIPNVPLKNQK